MRKIPGWVWFVAVPAVVVMAVAFVGERVDPDSKRIEKMGRDAIPAQTGHAVRSISCEKVLHIRNDMDLPCQVVLDDGTSYTSTAAVHAHYKYANHYGLSAKFSLPPRLRPTTPAPSAVPPAAPTSTRPRADADKLAACVQAAGSDVAKLQACTR